MKKLFFIVCLLVAGSSLSYGQLLISGGADVIKSDFVGVGEKVQMGAEYNYFIAKKFSLSAGLEFWTASPNSVALGIRYYPINPVFIRARGLIGNSDFAVGMGYWVGLSKQLRAEAALDYYVVDRDAALRVGLAYRINW